MFWARDLYCISTGADIGTGFSWNKFYLPLLNETVVTNLVLCLFYYSSDEFKVILLIIGMYKVGRRK